MRLQLSYIIFIAGLLLNHRGYSQCENENLDSFPYLEYGSYLDKKPCFEKGKEALINWFNANINYPPALAEHKLQVNFYVKVVADTNGRIYLIKTFCSKIRNESTKENCPLLHDSIARTLNREMVRLIGIFPEFVSGWHAGKKRKVSFIFTLKFNPNIAPEKFIATSDPFIIPIYPPQ